MRPPWSLEVRDEPLETDRSGDPARRNGAAACGRAGDAALFRPQVGRIHQGRHDAGRGRGRPRGRQPGATGRSLGPPSQWPRSVGARLQTREAPGDAPQWRQPCRRQSRWRHARSGLVTRCRSHRRHAARRKSVCHAADRRQARRRRSFRCAHHRRPHQSQHDTRPPRSPISPPTCATSRWG